jgi:general secretion pathway protein G
MKRIVKRAYSQKPIRRGFTFLELMLVVAILGILVAIAAPRLVGKAKKAKIKATRVAMKNISTSLGMYEQDQNDFPTTEQGLQALVTRPSDVSEDTWEKYMDKIPLDAWGEKFQYTCPSEHGEDYDLISGGPDRRIGNDDDITNYTKEGAAAAK